MEVNRGAGVLVMNSSISKLSIPTSYLSSFLAQDPRCLILWLYKAFFEWEIHNSKQKQVDKFQYLVWDFSKSNRRLDLKFSFSFWKMKHPAVMFWRIPTIIWSMIQVGKVMTEKVPHDPSLFKRDFIIYYYF